MIFPLSWPGFLPAMTVSLLRLDINVDARDKRGHDAWYWFNVAGHAPDSQQGSEPLKPAEACD